MLFLQGSRERSRSEFCPKLKHMCELHGWLAMLGHAARELVFA